MQMKEMGPGGHDSIHTVIIWYPDHTVTMTHIKSGMQALFTSRTSAAAAAGRRIQMVLSTFPRA